MHVESDAQPPPVGVHVVVQLPPEQVYGEQVASTVPAPHVPWLHVPADTGASPLHDALPQLPVG